jgi:hypothetical protein
MLIPLHPANDTPSPVTVRHCQRHGLGAVFRNSIMIMLTDIFQIRTWPQENYAARNLFHVQRKPDTGRVRVPLQRERCPANHDQS